MTRFPTLLESVVKAIEVIRLVLRVVHLIDVDALRKFVHDVEAGDAKAALDDGLLLAEKALANIPATAAPAA